MFKRFFLKQMYPVLLLQLAVTEDMVQGPTLADFTLLWMNAGFKKNNAN